MGSPKRNWLGVCLSFSWFPFMAQTLLKVGPLPWMLGSIFGNNANFSLGGDVYVGSSSKGSSSSSSVSSKTEVEEPSSEESDTSTEEPQNTTAVEASTTEVSVESKAEDQNPEKSTSVSTDSKKSKASASTKATESVTTIETADVVEPEKDLPTEESINKRKEALRLEREKEERIATYNSAIQHLEKQKKNLDAQIDKIEEPAKKAELEDLALSIESILKEPSLQLVGADDKKEITKDDVIKKHNTLKSLIAPYKDKIKENVVKMYSKQTGLEDPAMEYEYVASFKKGLENDDPNFGGVLLGNSVKTWNKEGVDILKLIEKSSTKEGSFIGDVLKYSDSSRNLSALIREMHEELTEITNDLLNKPIDKELKKDLLEDLNDFKKFYNLSKFHNMEQVRANKEGYAVAFNNLYCSIRRAKASILNKEMYQELSALGYSENEIPDLIKDVNSRMKEVGLKREWINIYENNQTKEIKAIVASQIGNGQKPDGVTPVVIDGVIYYRQEKDGDVKFYYPSNNQELPEYPDPDICKNEIYNLGNKVRIYKSGDGEYKLVKNHLKPIDNDNYPSGVPEKALCCEIFGENYYIYSIKDNDETPDIYDKDGKKMSSADLNAKGFVIGMKYGRPYIDRKVSFTLQPDDASAFTLEKEAQTRPNNVPEGAVCCQIGETDYFVYQGEADVEIYSLDGNKLQHKDLNLIMIKLIKTPVGTIIAYNNTALPESSEYDLEGLDGQDLADGKITEEEIKAAEPRDQAEKAAAEQERKDQRKLYSINNYMFYVEKVDGDTKYYDKNQEEITEEQLKINCNLGSEAKLSIQNDGSIYYEDMWTQRYISSINLNQSYPEGVPKSARMVIINSMLFYIDGGAQFIEVYSGDERGDLKASFDGDGAVIYGSTGKKLTPSELKNDLNIVELTIDGGKLSYKVMQHDNEYSEYGITYETDILPPINESEDNQ